MVFKLLFFPKVTIAISKSDLIDGLYGADFTTRNSILPFLEIIPDVNISSVISSSPKFLPHQPPIIPCNNPTYSAQPVLQQSSCLALKYNVILVLDMGDLQPCTPATSSDCPADGRFQYNTQVAFSESGQLLAKYHKSHLYYETQVKLFIFG
jgi:hypothetical protein